MTQRRYVVLLVPSAKRELAGLSVAAGRSVARTIDGLATEPRPPGSKLLAGRTGERVWRVRAADFRVLYAISDRQLVVLVIRIGHRREVYRGATVR